MIFQTTNAIDKILRREKTQTRRIIKGHVPEICDGFIRAVYLSQGCPPVYEVGHTYAVQPGRTKRALWWYMHPTMGPMAWSDNAPQTLWPSAKPLRIRILSIRREDVRNISNEDVRAEGYPHTRDFLHAWCAMHDPVLERTLWGEEKLMARPADHYQAWALTFEVAQ